MMDLVVVLVASTFRVSVPLIFASLGGFFAERSGVIDISLEGKMLVGAFLGAVVAHATGSAWLGALAAGGAGLLVGALYGLLAITWRANQIVTGTAINMLAAGVPPFLLNVLYGTPGSSPALKVDERFSHFPAWACWLAVVLIFLWINKARSGRWLLFAGEHAQALATAGISVVKTRWMALLVGGFLTGLGGASLSLYLSSSFSRNMTSGRGFMALAALILGKWRPIPAALACLLFGFADAAQNQLQNATFWNGIQIPVQFIQVLPYVLTIVISAGFLGRSRAPRELGIPFSSN